MTNSINENESGGTGAAPVSSNTAFESHAEANTKRGRAKVEANLNKIVEFDVLAKGVKRLMTGILVGYVPAGKTLTDLASVKSTQDKLEGYRDENKIRSKADVCIVRTTNPEDGTIRFFTPRMQQVHWPQ